MFSKKQRLDDQCKSNLGQEDPVCQEDVPWNNFVSSSAAENMENETKDAPELNEIVPREVWCIIFSYLDAKSIRSSTATCKLWFELIRRDLKISSHICLVIDGLEEFRKKLQKSEWMWERWPALKTLEFRPLSIYELYSCQEAKYNANSVCTRYVMDLVKSINFKQCETLEKVMFSVDFDRYFWDEYHGISTVEQLTFNPKVEMKSFAFGIEHISKLVLSMSKLSKAFYYFHRVRTLFHNDLREDMDFFINDFCSMFKGLNDSLETISFTKNEGDGSNYKLFFAILKLLSEQCKNLSKIVLDSMFNLSAYPSLGCFQNLKELTVPELCHIDLFDQNYDTITDLSVEKVENAELTNYDLRTMCQNFKKLKRCYFNVRVHLNTNWRQCYEWQNIVDEIFQESTEVKFVFKMKLYHVKKVTKLPYQKSTFECLMKYEKDEMDQGLDG